MKRALQLVLFLAALTWCVPASAQIARVGTPAIGDSGASSVTTQAAAAASHTAGHTLVALLRWANSARTVSSVTNTALDTFVQGTSCLQATGNPTDIWYVASTAGNASDVVTVHLSGAATFVAIEVFDLSGTAASPFEVCKTGTATSTLVTSASFTPAGSTNYNVAVGSQSVGGGTWTAGTNYTNVINSGTSDVEGEERTSVPGSAQTASITYSISSAMGISVASFKAAAAGAAVGFDKRHRYEQADE